MKNEQQSDVATEIAIPRRHHSLGLVSTIREWVTSVDVDRLAELAPVRSVWLERLTAVASEASFLGFTRTVRLCRAMHTAVQKQGGISTSLSSSQRNVLMRGLKSLHQLVVDHQAESSSHLQEIVHDLQNEFHFTQDDSSASINGTMSATASELTSHVGERSHLEHRDMDVYRNARLDSLDQCLEEESWIVTQLGSLAEDLASGRHSGSPAGRLMHVLRNHKFFNQVDRVCLAGRVAHGNQLVVVDASLSDRCSENSLKKGYSCFVNPDGSLFKMKPGTVRIFGNCERVLASFAGQGKPAQRSIALVSDQGLQSGLCLAIGRGNEIQGFLFLNSIQEDLFRDITTSSAPLLSLFGLVATIGLDTSGFYLAHNSNRWLDDSIPRSSTVFDSKHFAMLVERALELLRGPGSKSQVVVHRDDDAKGFLYLPTTIVGAIAQLLFRTLSNPSQNSVTPLDLTIEAGDVRMAFSNHCDPTDDARWSWLANLVRSVNDDFQNKPVRVRLTKSKVVVEFPFEPLLAGHKELLYSTVY